MSDYEFKYIAPPISEIPKIKIIEANDIFEAIDIFKRECSVFCEVLSVELI